MKTVDLIGYVDEQHQLHVDLFDLIPPGPVRIIVAPMMEQDAESDWREMIYSILARDWDSPKEREAEQEEEGA